MSTLRPNVNAITRQLQRQQMFGATAEVGYKTIYISYSEAQFSTNIILSLQIN